MYCITWCTSEHYKEENIIILWMYACKWLFLLLFRHMLMNEQENSIWWLRWWTVQQHHMNMMMKWFKLYELSWQHILNNFSYILFDVLWLHRFIYLHILFRPHFVERHIHMLFHFAALDQINRRKEFKTSTQQQRKQLFL